MTLATQDDIVDAEIVEEPHVNQQDFTEAEAREHTDGLRMSLQMVWNEITEAYVRGAHRALGYDSWDDYCRAEFGSSRLSLPREERAEAVRSLRESGLSLRAISSATGADVKTVRSDLAGVGISHTSTLGADGKIYEYSVPGDQLLSFSKSKPGEEGPTIAEALGIDMSSRFENPGPPFEFGGDEDQPIVTPTGHAVGSGEDEYTDAANGIRNDVQARTNMLLDYVEAVGKNLPGDNLPDYANDHVIQALKNNMEDIQNAFEWTLSQIKRN